MSYKNKTYIIFDADNDIWAYRYMRGWKSNENIKFNFDDAHDLNNLRDGSSEETIKRKLRQRFSSAKQVIVLIGDKTKNLFKFVRWEMEIALKLDLPIIAVNLNDKKRMDPNLCPPIIKDEYVVHIPFKKNIIKYALDNFPEEYANRDKSKKGPRYYNNDIYNKLGL